MLEFEIVALFPSYSNAYINTESVCMYILLLHEAMSSSVSSCGLCEMYS